VCQLLSEDRGRENDQENRAEHARTLCEREADAKLHQLTSKRWLIGCQHWSSCPPLAAPCALALTRAGTGLIPLAAIAPFDIFRARPRTLAGAPGGGLTKQLDSLPPLARGIPGCVRSAGAASHARSRGAGARAWHQPGLAIYGRIDHYQTSRDSVRVQMILVASVTAAAPDERPAVGRRRAGDATPALAQQVRRTIVIRVTDPFAVLKPRCPITTSSIGSWGAAEWRWSIWRANAHDCSWRSRRCGPRSRWPSVANGSSRDQALRPAYSIRHLHRVRLRVTRRNPVHVMPFVEVSPYATARTRANSCRSTTRCRSRAKSPKRLAYAP